MGNFIKTYANRYFALVPRVASHSLCAAYLAEHEPENYVLWQQNGLHPAKYLKHQLNYITDGAALAIMIRDPIERFRSICARYNSSVEHQIAMPTHKPIEIMPYTKIFRFPDQIQECADWLGITAPLLHLAASENKPILTTDQEKRVREIYAADIALWESLQL